MGDSLNGLHGEGPLGARWFHVSVPRYQRYPRLKKLPNEAIREFRRPKARMESDPKCFSLSDLQQFYQTKPTWYGVPPLGGEAHSNTVRLTYARPAEAGSPYKTAKRTRSLGAPVQGSEFKVSKFPNFTKRTHCAGDRERGRKGADFTKRSHFKGWLNE
jgi:hypothetical protein